jgi:glycosyltransferase involved in cell wall biosynthesis
MSDASDLNAARPRISLVVPVRDEEHGVADLLARIAAQARQPDEVIFVDGGSRDETVARLREAAARSSTIRIVEAGDATPGRGRNVGIDAATHEWIALTDAGNRLEPDWLERLVAVINRDPSVEVVYGNFEIVADTFFTRCAALVYPPVKVERPEGRIRAPFIASSLVRRDAWRKAGGFPDLRAAEDLIFMEELERRGCRIAWEPRATVWWELRPDFASTFRKFVLYSRHNVWAGRARYWHYGVARQYVVVLVFAALAALHSAWWLAGIALWLAARTFRSVWRRREGRGLLWALNPAQFVGVASILLTVDLATFVGWAQSLATRPTPARADTTTITPATPTTAHAPRETES